MKRKELLKYLDDLATEGVTSKEELVALVCLEEFIMQNTKEEEKIPSLLKGVRMTHEFHGVNACWRPKESHGQAPAQPDTADDVAGCAKGVEHDT